MYLDFKSRQMSFSFSILQGHYLCCNNLKNMVNGEHIRIIHFYWHFQKENYFFLPLTESQSSTPDFIAGTPWTVIQLSSTKWEVASGRRSLFQHNIPSRISRNDRQMVAEISLVFVSLLWSEYAPFIGFLSYSLFIFYRNKCFRNQFALQKEPSITIKPNANHNISLNDRGFNSLITQVQQGRISIHLTCTRAMLFHPELKWKWQDRKA